MRDGKVFTSGYIFGAFGVERDCGSWWITHLPTGACFLYSEWESLARAREFCERMLQLDEWQFSIVDRDKVARFNAAAANMARMMGERPRGMKAIA